MLAQLKRAEVEMFVCGQDLAWGKVDPKGLAPEVRAASDGLLALMIPIQVNVAAANPRG